MILLRMTPSMITTSKKATSSTTKYQMNKSMRRTIFMKSCTMTFRCKINSLTCSGGDQVQCHQFVGYAIWRSRVRDQPFLRQERTRFYGRDRVFVGPDGLEYQWSLGRRVPELVRLDSAKTPIARFRRRRLGILKKKRPASLEIFPEGTHMVDLIIDHHHICLHSKDT
ncbi:hypothetical protein M378DRAFT_759314 [Amanita muscaria Koide BX008]|uniref:DUF6593 domain-containing protein n=1 Tax=Amanita muscaria (strain Koide BX008) TaxID=946122 RepID=A0A0C2T774_AMAMK|nr:hypothetical protein M378DRAFT_759314 [Amanita muscaria Koide BX008]